MFKRLFGKPDPELLAAGQRIRDWVRAALMLDEDATVSVNEIDCGQPGCPDLETVILVRRAGTPTDAAKIHAGMRDVDEAQVIAALEHLAR